MNTRFTQWRTHTTVLLVVGFVLILVAIFAAYMLKNAQPKVSVRLGDSGVYTLRLADTDRLRVQGLSGVTELAPKDGLLMVFERDDYHGIWMKDMNVALDLVWLDADKKVVSYIRDVPPEVGTDEVFTPKKPSRYVIELPAGTVKQDGISIGDEADIKELGIGLW